MKKFLEEMEKNPELKAKMEELDKNPASTPKDFIKAAAEYGVELKEEDFQPADAQGELADDELDAVAGGDYCLCVIGGGGSATSDCENTCVCIVGGGGMFSDKSKYDGARCSCAVAGGGEETYS